MKLYTFRYFLIFLLFAVCLNAGDDFISVNQVGYLSNAEKYFITNVNADSFSVVSKNDNKIVYSGQIELHRENDTSTGITTYKGVFTDVNINGEYYIKVNDALKSFPFEISENVFDDIFPKVMKSYYLQRCGVDLDEKYAGEFAHKACHNLDAVFHPETGKTGIVDMGGGWHDAGDYGKYTHNTAVTLHIMLLGYQLFPNKYKNDNTNIDESGNGIPDFLDEIKFQLDWLLKMQDPETGGAYYMINTQNYTWSMPQKDTATRYIYDVASVSTGGFAAITALASRIYKSYDKEFSEKLLAASKFAWEFLEKNPEIVPTGGYRRPKDTHTGGYAGWPDKNDKDERLWASVELAIATGEKTYIDYVDNNKDIFRNINESFSWATVYANAKVSYMFSDDQYFDKSIKNELKENYIKNCNLILENVNKDGFYCALQPNEYQWGCNGDLSSYGLHFVVSHLLTGEAKYYNAALKQFNYLLGVNCHNISFIAKVGTNYVKHIHHAQLATDGVFDIFPGLLSGGPNKNIEDPLMKKLFKEGTPPAQCFVDHVESYSSNECCIFYSAPLTFLSAYFTSNNNSRTEEKMGAL